jgi:hypothetical protein
VDTFPANPAKKDVRALILSNHDSVRGQFVAQFGNEIDLISTNLADVLNRYRDLDNAVGKNRRIAMVTAFVYAAANSLLTSSQLLVSGMLIPSGHLMRQHAEAVAMALLCSSPKLDVFERMDKSPKTFPVHESLTMVGRKRSIQALNIDGKAWQEFVNITKFYDDLSHPSVLAVYSQFMFAKRGWLILGGEFDQGKVKEYGIELRRRSSAAKVLASLAEELVRRVPTMTAPGGSGGSAA